MECGGTHPEHGFAADIDVVLPHESQLAVVANAEHREAGRQRFYRIAVSHIYRQVVLCDQQTRAWIEVKSARMDLLRFDMLDRGRLAGGLIDRVYDDAVFAASENLPTLKLDVC